MSGLFGMLVFVWLIAGVAASAQRHYLDFTKPPTDCATFGTVAVTVVAGPLNYLGMNPKVHGCHLDIPQPSQ